MKKVLILGSTGMLGHMVHHFLDSTKSYDLFNLSFKNKLNSKTIILDITNQKKLLNKIEEIDPDIIINCIGVLIRGSKENTKNAIYINAYIPQLLKEICSSINCKLVHISTDCVFSGESGSYSENSVKDASDLYGKSKSLGEFDDEKHLCIRTSIIGPEIKKNGEGLMHWLLNQSGKVEGFKNVYWNGITTLELSKIINFSIEKNITGLWNCSSQSLISKYELLRIIINCYNLTHIDLIENLEIKSNKSLISIRGISYKIPDYSTMINELKLYMDINKKTYDYKF